MRKRASRLEKVATGVYKDRRDGSWEIFVRVKGLPLAHRHHPATLTKQDAIAERAALRNELRRLARFEGKGIERGTLAADVRAYLPLLDHNPRLKAERSAQLALWVERFGDRPRAALAAIELQQLLNEWASAGYSHSTIKHRRDALLGLFTALDPESRLPNPVRATSVPVPKPEPEPRGLPLDVALRILDALSDQGGVIGKGDPSRPKGMRGGRLLQSKTRARLHVMAFTGLRHEELKRYVPSDWRRDSHELVVRAAKGSNARVVPLSPDAEYWLRELEERDAIGRFDNGVLNRAFRRALARVGYAPQVAPGTWARSDLKRRRGALPGARTGHPGGPRSRTGLIRPYDLRHTFGTAVYQQTGDLTVTQAMLGHKDIRMTQRYAKNAVAHVQREAVAKVAAAVAVARNAVRTDNSDGQSQVTR